MDQCNYAINRLLNFGIQNGLLQEEDKIYAANRIIGTLGCDSFHEEEIDETLADPTLPLEKLLDFAAARRLIENTVTQRDLLDAKLMDCLMPRPSEVISKFDRLYQESPKEATDFFYHLSIASNYIRKSRVEKNLAWRVPTEYGNLEITINLSKPEKDPKEIAKAKNALSTGYPKCLLCRENEGFFGNLRSPARQNHRIIPLLLSGEKWFFQYSPYTYYNEHCIVLNQKHTPMKISRKTFENLLEFVQKFPHYFLGSNADLPIVGGSILSHDHYQGGRHTFAMEKACIEKEYRLCSFPDVRIGRVCWPMSVIRLTGSHRGQLLDLAEHILDVWRNYSDDSVNIVAASDGQMHNTITPIARIKNGCWEMDLVLRNNRCNKEYPLGIFHPHPEVHHIKKENIGLIEVMGLAVLPARLKQELKEVEQALMRRQNALPGIHSAWYEQFKQTCFDCSSDEIHAAVQNQVGQVFKDVLEHAGVFKRDQQGQQAFDRFVHQLQ